MLVGWQQRLNLPTNILLHFAAVQQMAEDGQSVRMASDVKAWMKQRCITELPPVEKNSTHWHSSTSTEHLQRANSRYEHREGWVVRFFSGDRGSGSFLLEQICMSAACSSCSSLVKCTADGGDYLGKYCFVAENLLYQIVLLCSFYLL